MRRVFVSCISADENERTALLQDDIEGPIASIDGGGDLVIDWARKQEADQHWLHGQEGPIPLT